MNITLFIYLFLERGREGERERNINVWLCLVSPPLGTWHATQTYALTGNRTSDPLVHRLALNSLNTPGRVESIFFFYICKVQLYSDFRK